MKKDIEIAQEAILEPISKIAEAINIPADILEPYGHDKAKVDPSKIADGNKKKNLVLVTAINPTKAGEGKSTTTIALADGLKAIGKSVMACLREPSLGPVFGLKGGAAGGGYAQVVPMEDINLHFTGDMHAITTANNLISAVLDNHLYQGNELNIDPSKVVWKRAMDMNDRTLRDITIGQKKRTNGVEREDHFNITVASEVMAILCLSNSLMDFKEKIGKCLVAYTYDDQPVYVSDLGIEGALATVMKDAIKPNLVQTLEHTPVFIHGGPFANIAHGCNSILATKTALKLADYVVTEAGFGADLGAEKFLDIKCRKGNLTPKAVVVVATCRALKLHGGVDSKDVNNENVDAMLKGTCNLKKHLESLSNYGIPAVVCINRFYSDTEAELDALLNYCKEEGYEAVICEGFAKGSEGSKDLAEAVVRACEKDSSFHYLYEDEMPLKEKIEKVATVIYGASGVEYSEEALGKLEVLAEYDNLPICMAKTPLSLSDDPKLVGRPDHILHVKDLSLSRGAGFVVIYTGNIMTMPGLPAHPAALDIDINEEGKISGLF